MDEKLINKIVWWIPNKNIRAFLREQNEIYSRIRNMENRLDDLYFLNLKNIFNKEMLDILQIKDYSILNDKVYNYWFRYGVANNFLDLLYLISQRYNIWNEINHNFWLIYISSLYEQNNFDLAQDILIKYIEKYKFLDIHRFSFVSKFAKQMGITNNDIEKTIFISNKLDKSIENKIFENTIKDKRVAIVGNAPSEIGKSKGKLIDAYDLVIRFNNYEIKGFEDDYGNKTDIWIRNGCVNKERDLSKYKLYIFEPDIYHIILNDYHINTLYNDLKNYKIPITYFTYDIHKYVRDASNQELPTIGLITILAVNKIKEMYNCDKLNINNLYGFSFIDNICNKDLYHYFNDIDNDFANYETSRLKFDKEILFLRKLFNL